MAAYAALTSLMHILRQIQHHPHPPITIEKQQMESLCENINFLQDFLENYSNRRDGGGCKESLEVQIADAAYKAEDVIESHVVDEILANSTFHEENNYIHLFCQGVEKTIQILAGSTSHSYSIFCQALQKVIEKMVPVKKEVIKIKDKQPTRKNNTMLSFDVVFTEVMDRLTAQPSNPQILPMLGSSGIALTSVMHIMELVHNPPRAPFTLHKQHMDSLSENITLLQDFLENYSHGEGCKEAQALLETHIVDAAYAAEDIIETCLVDISHPGSNNLFYQDLEKVINDMNLIKKEAIKIQEKIRGLNHQLPRTISTSAGSSARPPANSNSIMVGCDDVLIEIMDKLTSQQLNRQSLSIVGMGGIGKTTLARNVYDHPTVVQHFHICVWVTLSQECRIRYILLEALHCISKPENNEKYLEKFSDDQMSEYALGEQLYKGLSGKRYLIVLDDVWSIEAWEELMLFFPDNKNGSRIIITTRMSNVAEYFGSCGFKMNLLDQDKSWKLLHKTVFPQDQCCPSELEETGKKIARNCEGLPLSIVVIGGLLAKSEKTLEYWEYVAKNLNLIITLEENERCLEILSLSYNHLPVHLKPCFLHMGVFHEDKEIRVSTLIQLWVAEGFLKPIKDKSMEVVAEEYLKDLIDRNLILVIRKWGHGTKIKFCNMHGLLRDLCLMEAQKEKFLWIRRLHNSDILDGIYSQRRICIHQSTSKEEYEHLDQILRALPSSSLARSLICNANGVLSSLANFRLLRVFKTADKYFLEDIFQLVNSRYLDFRANWNSNSIFSSSIHLLWNLQTLIVKDLGGKQFVVPREIWEMSQLRHVEIDWHILPDPPNVPIQEGDDGVILRNLQTLLGTTNFKFSEEVIERIPNIKKLQVYYVGCPEGWLLKYCVNNLGRLNQLESLVCKFRLQENPNHREEFLQNFAFPHSLKKLTLIDTRLLWEDHMRMIGSLPHLEVLKLKIGSFHGPEWNPVEGEFLCLKFLLIELCRDLHCWNADRTHFPLLEHLVLHFLDNLKEIPLDIGEITTLKSIELLYCSDSAVESAKNIVDVQKDFGNVGPQIRVHGGKRTEAVENLEIEILKFKSLFDTNATQTTL